jgi:cystathionine beta-lyase
MNLHRRIDRRGTASLKWDFQKRLAGVEGLLPLWVADMDFPSPRQVQAALRRRTRHPIYGYTLEPESWYEAAMQWTRSRHGWELRRDWLLACPGVVPAIDLAILAFSAPGDSVVIQPPVYHPFASSIRRNGREVLENPLRLEGSRYSLDLRRLEESLTARTPQSRAPARLLLLCSPHNPVARVWRREELEGLAELCLRRGLIVVSDEIHCDLVLPGHRHLPTGSLPGEVARRTVTLLSATKTFNLAGLGGSLAVIPDPELRRRFRAAKEALWTGAANALSVVAAEAAWRHGAPWLERVLAYVAANYRLLTDCLGAKLPAVRVFPLEGTYLAWLDLRALGLTDVELKRRILQEARVWLDDGPLFGSGGRGFQRLNLACPRAILREALGRLVGALS